LLRINKDMYKHIDGYIITRKRKSENTLEACITSAHR
jgi:hypothetical protein